MNFARLLLHPVMVQRRSRAILFWYVACAALTSLVLWWRVDHQVATFGTSLAAAAAEGSRLGQLLVQPYFRGAIVLASGILAAGLTSMAVIGPARRIEEWLLAWERGLPIKPLKVRSGDQYETMIRLLNELQQKSAQKRAAKTPSPAEPPVETPNPPEEPV